MKPRPVKPGPFRWSDRRHWEWFIGRVLIFRWCTGAPCRLPGVRRTWHPIKIEYQRRRRYM